MTVKEWFRRLQPVQLYLVLFFTTAFFVVEIITSHVTHSLTLLLNAYHMLCNIVALIGSIASVKYARKDNCADDKSCGGSSICIQADVKGSDASMQHRVNPFSNMKALKKCLPAHNFERPHAYKNYMAQHLPLLPLLHSIFDPMNYLWTHFQQSTSERRMKNTFGWARIDILTMLVCCVFLASFCFSLFVEAFQTLVHIDHLDEMHHPLPVMCIGISGILLNGFCYVIIGGYTFNQGIFLHVTKEGNVIVQRTMPSDGVMENEQRLSKAPGRESPLALPRRQSYREMLRDVFGCVLIIIASIIVHFTDAHLAKFIDPIFAIVSAILLLILSYPYMRESGLILLQTIPNHINIDSLKKELLEEFPGIVNVHDLHVWHLAGERVICTAHIIFLDPKVYARITGDVTDFFVEMGITQVTIQPEFHKIKSNIEQSPCLIRCQGKRCKMSQCCSKEESHEDHNNDNSNQVHKRLTKKKTIPTSSVIDLTKFKRKKSESTQSVTEDERFAIPVCNRTTAHRKSCPESSIFAIDVEIVETSRDTNSEHQNIDAIVES